MKEACSTENLGYRPGTRAVSLGENVHKYKIKGKNYLRIILNISRKVQVRPGILKSLFGS